MLRIKIPEDFGKRTIVSSVDETCSARTANSLLMTYTVIVVAHSVLYRQVLTDGFCVQLFSC